MRKNHEWGKITIPAYDIFILIMGVLIGSALSAAMQPAEEKNMWDCMTMALFKKAKHIALAITLSGALASFHGG